MAAVYHIPAMLEETIAGLAIRPGGVYVDVTLGGGGHSRAILERLNSEGHLYSLDQDSEAISNQQSAISGQRSEDGARWTLVHGNFRYLANFMDYYGVEQIDGLLADLGVSFHHFDEAERGFSFRFDGPLDMRMNQHGGRTAAEIVNTYAQDALAHALYLYGELKNAKQLASKIIAARPIATTWDLLEALTGSRSLEMDPRKKKEVTCVFQALRIEVNDELGALRELLVAAKELLRPGGRIAILTYHSLEDRIVKNFLRSGNLDGTIEKDFYGNILTPFKLIEKGLTASDEEVAINPRARSAKLRVAEKV
ncbi:MAG: 16S rRNA (cytosine(1402)-N(4))-methyltransferase RsmH [Paludibacteraceae bacterium]|nr:16S rRNA (cytosine(1402)-N(4))-methyltransferase RsmH [Paludibacteraceae bacterium]